MRLGLVFCLLTSACAQSAEPARVAASAHAWPYTKLPGAPASKPMDRSTTFVDCSIAQKSFYPRDPITLVTPRGVPFATLADAEEVHLHGSTLSTTVFGLRLHTLARGEETADEARSSPRSIHI